MDIFRVIGIGIIGAIASYVLKRNNSDYSALIIIATGIIILVLMLASLQDVILAFNRIIENTGVTPALYSALLKIVGIGYVTEYAQSICVDLDAASIGKKVSFAGKIAIFVLALPIVTALIDIIGMLI
jgi:stage III sporulation protein AD